MDDFVTRLSNFLISVQNEERQDGLGRRELNLAAARNDVLQIEHFLSQGMDVNIVNTSDVDGLQKTSLHWAASENNEESHLNAMEVLLKNGADINIRDACGKTPFYDLLHKCNTKMVQLFLDYGADLNVEDHQGETLLFAAASENKNVEVVQLLIDQLGLDVKHQSKYQKTPLHAAVENDNIESMLKIVEILLKNGADINAIDNHMKQTPLFKLVQKGNLEAVQLFLNSGAKCDILDVNGENLLFPAVESKNCEKIIQLLINLGLDAKHRNNTGSTPLHKACQHTKDEKIKLVKLLMSHGSDLNAVDQDGWSPLIDAVCSHTLYFPQSIEEKKLKFMLQHADVNIIGSNGEHILPDSLSEESSEIIIQHLAKLKILNILVHPDLLEAISNEEEYREYYNQCIEELIRAKEIKLPNSWITFYNLLMDDKKRLKNYAGNEDLVNQLEKSYCEEKFPIHGAAMYENLKKGIERRELFDKSAVSLSNYLPIFNSNHLIIRDVLDCVMSKKNLSKLCM